MDRVVGVPRGRSLVPALALTLTSLLLVGVFALLPQQGTVVAVVFAPWGSPTDALKRVAAADGLVLREGAFGNILVTRSDSPDFIDRLYRAGAWAVLNPVAFSGCWSPTGIGGEE